MRLNKITLANFRGFLDKQSIPFGPQITILVGANGFGKSTVIDAVEWLLAGQLQRYLGSEEGRREDYIRHVDATGEPYVDASFAMNEKDVTLRRTRNSREKSVLQVRSGSKNWLNENDAEQVLKQIDSDISKEAARTYIFSDNFISYHLLGQQTIQDFVKSDPRERYEKLVRAKPPLSPSFYPHSLVSDIRSVLGGVSSLQ